jgi:hypothetical protein
LVHPSSIIDIDSLSERELQKLGGVVLLGAKKQYNVEELE